MYRLLRDGYSLFNLSTGQALLNPWMVIVKLKQIFLFAFRLGYSQLLIIYIYISRIQVTCWLR